MLDDDAADLDIHAERRHAARMASMRMAAAKVDLIGRCRAGAGRYGTTRFPLLERTDVMMSRSLYH